MSDLEELTGVAFWTLFLAVLTFSVFLSVALTWPVCALVLAVYRRSVQAGMHTTAGPEPAGGDVPDHDNASSAGNAPGRGTAPDGGNAAGGGAGRGAAAETAPPASAAALSPRIAVAEIARGPSPALVALAHRRARRAQVVFAAAGLVFGVASTVVYQRVSGEASALRTFPVQALLLSWLAVPTVIALGFTDRRTRLTVWAGYLAAVVLLAVTGGAARAAAVDFLVGVVAVPGLFVLATGTRTLRGAAWFVAPALVALGLTVAAAYPPLIYLRYGLAFDRSAWILLVSAVALPVLVALYGAVVTLLYARKWASDDTLLILQWWFVLALTQVILLGTQGAAAAAWALAPFAAMVLLLLGAALVARRAPPAPLARREPLVRRAPTTPSTPTANRSPARLLLLRTFGDRGRSSRLLRDLTVHWRWVGSVELITGTDLATELLEPHEFLDYLRGRLRRHFVRGSADLARRLDELDLRPDLDGRYRINELLCHDDTWRPALAALVHEVDAVLIDLRGLTPQRTGVVYEIEHLVAEVPLHRVVALADATTDQGVLRWALDRAAARAPGDAPFRDDPEPALRTVALTGGWSADFATVLDAVGQAAAPGPTNTVRR